MNEAKERKERKKRNYDEEENVRPLFMRNAMDSMEKDDTYSLYQLSGLVKMIFIFRQPAHHIH